MRTPRLMTPKRSAIRAPRPPSTVRPSTRSTVRSTSHLDHLARQDLQLRVHLSRPIAGANVDDFEFEVYTAAGDLYATAVDTDGDICGSFGDVADRAVLSSTCRRVTTSSGDHRRPSHQLIEHTGHPRGPGAPGGGHHAGVLRSARQSHGAGPTSRR